jgi:hypothetical protein
VRRHRDAWQLLRNVVASSHSRVGRDSFEHSDHQVGSQRTAGAFHASWFVFRHRWRHFAPLGGPLERRGSCGRFVKSGLLRGAVQHANGADAPDGLVRSCHCGARLICNVGRTDQKLRNTNHSDAEQIASGSSAHRGHLHHSGVRFRATWHSWAAARCRVSLSSAVSTQGTSRRRGQGALSGVGVFRSCRRRARRSWLSRTAARQRREARRSGTVDAVGLFNACANIRSSLSVTRVVGLVSNGVLKSPEWVAAVSGVTIAPLGG